jgi:hypothetical protein
VEVVDSLLALIKIRSQGVFMKKINNSPFDRYFGFLKRNTSTGRILQEMRSEREEERKRPRAVALEIIKSSKK